MNAKISKASKALALITLVVMLTFTLLPAAKVLGDEGDIELIAKIAPANDGFVGMVDADQVIGGGAAGTLPCACINWSCGNISDLGNVNATSPTDNQSLTWDNATSMWIPETITGGGGTFSCSNLSTCNITDLSDGSEVKTVSITFIIDGVCATIATGEKGHLEIPFNCTIQRVTMEADQTGSIIVDIWKDTYANFPPTNADTITSATPPTITTAQKSQDSTLTNWTTSISEGDILAYNVDSCTNITRVTVSLKAIKT